jgi:iron complex outermembrane receptor protein
MLFKASLAVSTSFFPTAALAQAVQHAVEGQTPEQVAQGQASAEAPDTQDTRSGEIIVTARRKAESLQEVPLAVTVLSQDTLRDRAITRVQDIATLTPGLEANPGPNNSNQANFTIRGQGSTFSGGNSGVATYLAEVPEFASDIFDLANVQVLKGPQGTLFGRVTTGGAVLLTPVMPGDTLEGFLNAKLGQYGLREVEFGVGTPVIQDVLSIRVSGVSRRTNGFTRNLFNGSRGDAIDNDAIRAIAKLELGDFTNTTLAQFSRDRSDNRSTQLFSVSAFAGNNRPIPRSLATAAGIVCGASCPTVDAYLRQELAATPGRGKGVFNENNQGYNNRTESKGVINTSTLDLGNISLKNIFSIRSTNINGTGANSNDATAVPVFELITVPSKGPRILTDEFQVQGDLLDSRLKVTAGGYLEDSKARSYGRTIIGSMGGFPASSPGLSAATCGALGARNEFSDGYCHFYVGYISRQAKTDATDKALYGQGTFEVTDAFTITAGYRYTWSKRATYDGPQLTSNALRAPGAQASEFVQIPGMQRDLITAPTNDIPGVIPLVQKGKKGTYTLAADYKVTPDILVYATTRTGYKPGGFNANANPENRFFGPETVTDYEVGVKTAWRMGEVSGILNFDAYRDNYSGIQRGLTVVVGGNPVTVIDNAAKARIQGFDVEGSVRVGGFNLGAFYSYTDAKYLEYPNTGQFPAGFDPTTLSLANVTKHRWGLTPSFDLNGFDPDLPKIVLSGNLLYQGEHAISDQNGTINPVSDVPARTLVNARIDWKDIADSNISAGIAVTNLTNNRDRIQGVNLLGVTGLNYTYYERPRTVYGEVRFRF